MGCMSVLVLLFLPCTAYGNTYGSGTYGSCQYSSCSITLTSTGTITDAITPTSGSSTCSIANDAVSVTTGSSTGYTVSLIDNDTSNQMTGSNGGTISASSGTSSAPTTLSVNTWGYRVDGAAAFGAGPTSATTNTTTPSLTFAAVPLSSGTPDTIISSSVAASTPATTNVWYGTCTDVTIPSGSYTDSVVYTALTQ